MQLLIQGSLINYQDINPKQKDTLIILHGWGQNSQLWLPLVKLLPTTHRYLILDLPGFGSSQHLTHPSPDVPNYTLFLNNFITKLKLPTPSLMGHSFGGQIVMDYAVTHPQSLKSLFLISPAGIRQRTSKTNLRRNIFRFFKPIKPLIPPFIQNLLRPLFTTEDYINAVGKQKDILKNILRYDLSPRLDQIKVPTHIIWGDLDVVIPYKGKYMAQHINNSTLHVLYGAEHNPHIFKTQLLADVITPLL